jgi:peptidoglycan hydrolase-like protein with peptidoglycan-binding domain
MKKYLLGFCALAALAVFSININYADAQSATVPGCNTGDKYSRTTGQPCATTPVSEGCAPGDKYDSRTGMPCEAMPILVPTPVPPPWECPVEILPVGTKGEAVREIQTELKEKGYYSGRIDGIYGAMTSQAVTSYVKILPYCYPPQQLPNPVISGVKGPQSLNVGQKGTWTVAAYDPEGGELYYYVTWGDEEIGWHQPAVSALIKESNQTATFTHSYAKAGIYNPRFVVQNENGSEETSLSVKVGSVSVVKATDSDDSPDYSKVYPSPITPKNYPDLFVKGVSKGIYPGTGDGGLIYGEGVSPPSPEVKYIAGPHTIYYDHCASDTQLNEGYIRKSTGEISSVGVNPPVGYKCKNGAFVSSSDGQIEPYVFYEINEVKSDGKDKVIKLKYGEPASVSWKSNGDYCEGHVYDRSVSWNGIKSPSGSEIVRNLPLGKHVFVINCYSSKYEKGNYAKDDTLTVEVVSSTSSSVTVLSPNGGETWAQGTSQTIKWQDMNSVYPCFRAPCPTASYDLTLVGVEPSSGSVVFPGFSERIIAKEVKGPSYKWVIPNCYSGNECSSNFQIAEGAYKIQVCQSGTKVCDSSDSYFKITSNNAKPTITVLSPKGGETWSKGTTQIIKWQSTNTTALNTVDLIGLDPYTGKRNSSYSIAKTQNSSYTWKVGENLNGVTIVDGSYILQVCQTATFPNVCDERQFKIGSGTTTSPYLTVLSPNGGETWAQGTSQTIKWRDTSPVPSCMPELPCIYPFKYDIYLYYDTPDGGYGSALIAESVSGSSYKWSVAQLLGSSTYSGRMKIKVCLTGSEKNCDYSDGYFKITPNTTTQPLTLNAERHGLSPSGYVSYGQNTELFRAVIKPTGKTASIKKFTFDVVGNAVPHVSNMTVYSDGGVAIGKLSNLKNTWSSTHYTAEAVVDWGIEVDVSANLSVVGNISSTGVGNYMWINLTGIELDSGHTISGLPVYGHQFNISTYTTNAGTSTTTNTGDGGHNAVYGAETFAFTARLTRGSSGNEVTELQKFLNKNGHYYGVVDGKFGAATEAAVMSLQNANGLKPDGIVGTEVRAILNK